MTLWHGDKAVVTLAEPGQDGDTHEKEQCAARGASAGGRGTSLVPPGEQGGREWASAQPRGGKS